MDLFSNEPYQNRNLLYKDGEVYYMSTIFSHSTADFYYENLLNTIQWKNDEAFIFGKHYITKRKVAWYADKPYAYRYSGTLKTALPWTDNLLEIKNIIERQSGESFNSCLLNLYHNGDEGMAWHSDGEKELVENGCIASVSFGAQRQFAFKHKVSKETIRLPLAHGSLLLMKGTTQKNWLHRLPKTKKVSSPRINLTFRQMKAV